MAKSKESPLFGLFALCITPLLGVLHGWVLSILWDWFVVATFHVPRIGVISAIGLGLVVGMFMPDPPKPESDSEYPIANAVVKGILRPLIFLGIAACWHACQ